jgi:hypothetical protein
VYGKNYYVTGNWKRLEPGAYNPFFVHGKHGKLGVD